MRTRVRSPSARNVSASAAAEASLSGVRLTTSTSAHMSMCSYVQYTGFAGWQGYRFSGCERSERREHLLVVRLVPRVVQDFAVADHTLFVDDEHRAFRDPLETDHVLVEHAVVPNHLFVEVAEQRERELLVIVERFEREERVDADAEHVRVGLAQARD